MAQLNYKLSGNTLDRVARAGRDVRPEISLSSSLQKVVKDDIAAKQVKKDNEAAFKETKRLEDREDSKDEAELDLKEKIRLEKADADAKKTKREGAQKNFENEIKLSTLNISNAKQLENERKNRAGESKSSSSGSKGGESGFNEQTNNALRQRDQRRFRSDLVHQLVAEGTNPYDAQSVALEIYPEVLLSSPIVQADQQANENLTRASSVSSGNYLSSGLASAFEAAKASFLDEDTDSTEDTAMQDMDVTARSVASYNAIMTELKATIQEGNISGGASPEDKKVLEQIMTGEGVTVKVNEKSEVNILIEGREEPITPAVLDEMVASTIPQDEMSLDFMSESEDIMKKAKNGEMTSWDGNTELHKTMKSINKKNIKALMNDDWSGSIFVEDFRDHPELNKRVMQLYDTNNDGVLSDTELSDNDVDNIIVELSKPENYNEARRYLGSWVNSKKKASYEAGLVQKYQLQGLDIESAKDAVARGQTVLFDSVVGGSEGQEVTGQTWAGVSRESYISRVANYYIKKGSVNRDEATKQANANWDNQITLTEIIR